jgi:hypothetical protein
MWSVRSYDLCPVPYVLRSSNPHGGGRGVCESSIGRDAIFAAVHKGPGASLACAVYEKMCAALKPVRCRGVPIPLIFLDFRRLLAVVRDDWVSFSEDD